MNTDNADNAPMSSATVSNVHLMVKVVRFAAQGTALQQMENAKNARTNSVTNAQKTIQNVRLAKATIS